MLNYHRSDKGNTNIFIFNLFGRINVGDYKIYFIYFLSFEELLNWILHLINYFFVQ